MVNSAGENSLDLPESELTRRIRDLEKALAEKEPSEELLQASEKRYRCLFESAKDGILILDAETGMVVDVNPFLLQLLGYSYEALYGQYVWELGVFKDIAASKDAFKTLQDNEYIRYDDLPLETLGGVSIAVEFISNVYLVDQSKVIQCNIRDISARKRAEAERRRLLEAIDQAGEVIVMTDPEGCIEFVNPAFMLSTGYSREEAMGQNPRILKSGRQDELFYRTMWQTISGGRTWAGRIVNKRKDGTFFTEEVTISPVHDTSGKIVNYVAVKRDITEHLRLTAQLQQAQKMEAVGHLAGGVAHDFNNMLTVIIGYAEIAQINLDSSLKLHECLNEIINAAKRSSDITRQLLAFARKQIIQPVVLDLNRAVEGALKMFRRLIGEDIDLLWLPDPASCPVKMDPTQVDQILANLCVNARDAIAGVGKIRISTGNRVIDESYCLQHPGSVAGNYVVLAVSDTGCGMDKETLEQIFEPFFTSKGVGAGTGLGLSTVYGIVKQNNGIIEVTSEPGKGTTFTLYLPQYALNSENEVPKGQFKSQGPLKFPPGLGETVLLVEDEPSILDLSRQMLESLGYRVLAAATADEALAFAKLYSGEIQLLVTDVVMPGMNGHDLADRLFSLSPGFKTLFVSGYPSSMIAHLGVLNERINFIQKPFFMEGLAVKLREMLREGE